MIIDTISNMAKYITVVPGLKTVITVIEGGTLPGIADGKYTTDNPAVRYNVMSYATKNENPGEYEVHRKEIDVQIILKGIERIDLVWPAPVGVTKAYNEDTDALFVTGEQALTYHGTDKTFALFFPGEPHAPSLADGVSADVKKVVFKILG
jgi:YhcH/YjgK/YiaL family protein